MLTRLKVSGFKNLIDVDVPLGAFTCVAGANGTGKSNLFDAIQFLRALASHTLIDAAQSVRKEKQAMCIIYFIVLAIRIPQRCPLKWR